jgi:Domain of unknown function (DUF222)/HNH endonuclease
VAGVRSAISALRDCLDSLEIGTVPGPACAVLAEELAALEKRCAAARVRLVTRAAECGEHRSRGFVEPADWLARMSGVPAAAAREALTTMRDLERCPSTRDAVDSGEISLGQAHEVAAAELARPGSETDLLATARTTGFAGLRDASRRVRLGAVDRDALHREQQRRREVRHWRDELGMVCLRATLPPEVGAPLVNRLDAETDRVRRAARREGSTELRPAHAADALLRLASEPASTASRAEVVFVCDVRAWSRGHTHGDEVCHAIDGGPVPVSVVRERVADAFVKLVSHDGVRIDRVKHLGRRIPAELRTVLDLGPAPTFEGVVCTEEGCDRRYGLEWDHVDPVASGGITSYDNLQPRCWSDHREKTERERAAGRLGPTRRARPERAPP